MQKFAQNYHALTVEANRHMTHGLLYEASVTEAKNLTDDPSTSDAENGVVAEDTYTCSERAPVW